MARKNDSELRQLWDRFGALILLGSIFVLFVGIMVYASRTQNIERGNDRPMGVAR